MSLIFSKDQLTYQKTMQRIIQRDIFDIQREAEVTEGGHWNGVWRWGGGAVVGRKHCVYGKEGGKGGEDV